MDDDVELYDVEFLPFHLYLSYGIALENFNFSVTGNSLECGGFFKIFLKCKNQTQLPWKPKAKPTFKSDGATDLPLCF